MEGDRRDFFFNFFFARTQTLRCALCTSRRPWRTPLWRYVLPDNKVNYRPVAQAVCQKGQLPVTQVAQQQDPGAGPGNLHRGRDLQHGTSRRLIFTHRAAAVSEIFASVIWQIFTEKTTPSPSPRAFIQRTHFTNRRSPVTPEK
jgi:hypothetical protein